MENYNSLNKVIDIIEQNEGIDFEDASSFKPIEDYLDQVHYFVGANRNDCPETEYKYIDEKRGYCIEEVTGTNGKYYKVKTFIKLEIPFLDLGFTIPVKGETRKIEGIDT